MAAGHIGVSGVEAACGGKCTPRPVCVLPPLGMTEDMIHPAPHQLGNRYSSLRSKCSQSEQLLFRKLYLSPNHNRDDGIPS